MLRSQLLYLSQRIVSRKTSSLAVHLSIVLPAFNPFLGWENTVLERFSNLQKVITGEVELIVVNDGSTQNFGESEQHYLEEHISNVRFIHLSENRGKGFALRTGVKNALGKYIMYTDIDFPYQQESMLGIYQALLNGADIALGYRENDYYANVPTIRALISKCYRWLLKNILRVTITDTQCGLKGLNSECKYLFTSTSTNRFLFELEFVRNASKSRGRVEPVSVELKPEVVFSKVSLKVLLTEAINLVVIVLLRR